MTFLKRWFKWPGPSAPKTERQLYMVTVRCNRCGEIIAAPVDLRNDLSADYDADTGATTYVCRKGLLGRQRCFQTIDVTLRFDETRRLIDHEVIGGQVVE